VQRINFWKIILIEARVYALRLWHAIEFQGSKDLLRRSEGVLLLKSPV
jgi:hypothetical protein